MTARIIGIGLFVLAAALALWFGVFAPGDGGRDSLSSAVLGERPEPVDALALVGGEKMGFLENPRVQDILTDRHGVHLDARKAGSVEMVTSPALLAQNPDLLWPGSQVALELARDNQVPVIQDEIIFNSPIVLYSWLPIADGLEAAGLARPLDPGRTAFAVDTAALLDLIGRQTEWRDLGVDLYGTVMLQTTDPTRSNSGNQFAALATVLLAGGRPEGPDLDRALATLADLYTRMGYLQHSSGDLFAQYLRTGMGNKPLIAGYESQLIEFALAEPDRWAALQDQPIRPVILYPEPTVFSSHVALATSEAGRRVVTALEDPELQDLAWRRHGFRSGFAAENDPAAVPVRGIPATVSQVVPLPPARVIDRILETIRAIAG